MPNHVCNGATLMCSFGMAPSTLVVTPENRVLTSNQPAATIMDGVPMKNIMPFGNCMSPAFPATAAATAAALGVLTPMPCVPGTVPPWTPGSVTVLEGGGQFPVLHDIDILMCSFGGVIKVQMPGEMTEMVRP